MALPPKSPAVRADADTIDRSLHAAAARFTMGLSPAALEYVAALMELPLAWVTSVASFYSMYWKRPTGRWHLQVCRTISCQLRGADEILAALERRLSIHAGERTPDGRFSLEEVECLASCGTAPCLQVNNDAYHESMTVERTLALVERLGAE